MSELEPTLTNSNLTVTERLRAMLDERGVEWKAWDGTHPITVWHDETYLYEFIEYRLINSAKQVNGCPSDNDGHCELTIKVFNCTPEQAIAATLGQAVRHPKHHEQWTTVLLPEIAWSWDDSWPDYLSVAHDTNGEWRTYVPEATLWTGTCHVESSIIDTYEYNRWKYELSCGHTIIWEDSEPPNFCPVCGRRIEQ